MSIVEQNLKEAINGESNAKRKYELFKEQALRENLNEIASLFGAIAYAESIHIKNHLKALSSITKSEVNPDDFVSLKEDQLKKELKDTKYNLNKAIQGETFEFKKMYKGFIKNAIKGNDIITELSFDLARKAEKIHAKLFSIYLKKLEKNKNFQSVEIYVCTICGNVELGTASEICPVCDHDKKFFKKI